MNLNVEKSESCIINPMDYDFGEISSIQKVSNASLNVQSDKCKMNTINEQLNVSTEKPHLLTEKVWKEYQSMFPWLYHSGIRFLCSYCGNAYKKNGVLPNPWASGSLGTDEPDKSIPYNVSRLRFERHEKTQNHIFASKFLIEPTESSIWKILKDKYKWLDGNEGNPRCLWCEQAYKKNKNSMIVTIWTCPDLNNKQSPTHFSLSHRLDRHEKCKNHLLAVKLEPVLENYDTTPIKSIPTNRLTAAPQTPSKSPNELIRRSRKSAPVKSCKPSDLDIPTSISAQQFHTLTLRYPWVTSNDKASLSCTLCPDGQDKIIFERNSNISQISRQILIHSNSEFHNRSDRDCTDNACVTRLQRGIAPKIDYKRLSTGMDHVTIPVVEEISEKKESNRWSCPQCKSHFAHNPSLIEHISLCDSQSTKIVREMSCPCNPPLFNFSTITKMDLHSAQVHSSQELFNCYICSDRFNRLLILYEHMLVHHLINWDPFETYAADSAPLSPPQCIFCSLTFENNIDLTNHYCSSKCQQYLQPKIVIDVIKPSMIENHSIVSEVVPKIRKYTKYPNKLSFLSLTSQSIKVPIYDDEAAIKSYSAESETASMTDNCKNLFDTFLSTTDSTNYCNELVTVTKVKSLELSEQNNVTSIDDKVHIISASVDDVQKVVNCKESDSKNLHRKRKSKSLVSRQTPSSPKICQIKRANSMNTEEYSKISINDEHLEDTPTVHSKTVINVEQPEETSMVHSKTCINVEQPEETQTVHSQSCINEEDPGKTVTNDSKTSLNEEQPGESPTEHFEPMLNDQPEETLTTRGKTSINDAIPEIIHTKTVINDKQSKKTRIKHSKTSTDNEQTHKTQTKKNSLIIGSDNALKTRQGRSLVSEQLPEPDSNSRYKRRNCRSIFSRQSLESDISGDRYLEDKFESFYNKIQVPIKNKTHLSEFVNEPLQKISKTPKRQYARKIFENKDVKDNSVSNEQKEIQIENKQDKGFEHEKIAGESVKILSPEKKERSLYFDKLKEISTRFSWEVISDSVKKTGSTENVSSELIDNEMNPTDNEQDSNIESQNSLVNQESLDIGKIEENLANKLSTSIKGSNIDQDITILSIGGTKDSLNNNYEIISLKSGEKSPIKEKEDKYLQEISLSELKVCIEKTDLFLEHKRLKRVISKRKRVPMDNLHENLCASVTSMENEKRIRIPTEKLRESSDVGDRKRRRRRTSTFAKKQLIEEPVDDVPVSRKHRKKVLEMNSNNAMKIKNIRKKHSTRTDYNFHSNRKHIASDQVKQTKPDLPKWMDDTTVKTESKMVNKPIDVETVKPIAEIAKFPKLTNLLVDSVETNVICHSQDASMLKKPIMIQSQFSPPSKSMIGNGQDDDNMEGELSFMDRMKKIRQLKKIRTEKQREQMMAVDRTVAEINENALSDSSILAKSDKIQKLLTCDQYSMSDLKNILNDESKKRRSTDIDEYKPPAKIPKWEAPSVIELPKITKLSESSKLQLACDVCHQMFQSLRTRDKHIVDEHKGMKIFKCTLCDVSLATHLALRKHVHKCHPATTLPTQTGLGEVHKTKATTFQCHFCPLQCVSKFSLHNHITTVHRSTQEKHESEPVASLPVVVVDDFVNKLKNANPISKYQECPMCSEIVNNEFELAIHTIEHERENDNTIEANQFACPKCCRLFFGREGKTYLKDHYNIIHLQKPVPSCDECGTEFPSTWCYYEHKRTQKHCSKKTIDQMTMAADPYESLNDPIRLAFVCSRCQSLVAGDSAQARFDQHEVECCLQVADTETSDTVLTQEEIAVVADHEEETEEESLVMVVDETQSIPTENTTMVTVTETSV